MPQGPAHLHEKFGDVGPAWDVLKDNFHCKAGMIYPKSSLHEPTKEEDEAIDYLCLEWDFGYTQVYVEKK